MYSQEGLYEEMHCTRVIHCKSIKNHSFTAFDRVYRPRLRRCGLVDCFEELVLGQNWNLGTQTAFWSMLPHRWNLPCRWASNRTFNTFVSRPHSLPPLSPCLHLAPHRTRELDLYLPHLYHPALFVNNKGRCGMPFLASVPAGFTPRTFGFVPVTKVTKK